MMGRGKWAADFADEDGCTRILKQALKGRHYEVWLNG